MFLLVSSRKCICLHVTREKSNYFGLYRIYTIAYILGSRLFLVQIDCGYGKFLSHNMSSLHPQSSEEYHRYDE